MSVGQKLIIGILFVGILLLSFYAGWQIHESTEGDFAHKVETPQIEEQAPDDTSTVGRPTTPPEHPGNDLVACTLEAKLCPDGSAVGRTGPNCEFAPCPGEQQEPTICTDTMKKVDACAEIYQPVCGLVEVQCVTALCHPVAETFGNACTACAQGNVTSYTEGECILEVI